MLNEMRKLIEYKEGRAPKDAAGLKYALNLIARYHWYHAETASGGEDLNSRILSVKEALGAYCDNILTARELKDANKDFLEQKQDRASSFTFYSIIADGIADGRLTEGISPSTKVTDEEISYIYEVCATAKEEHDAAKENAEAQLDEAKKGLAKITEDEKLKLTGEKKQAYPLAVNLALKMCILILYYRQFSGRANKAGYIRYTQKLINDWYSDMGHESPFSWKRKNKNHVFPDGCCIELQQITGNVLFRFDEQRFSAAVEQRRENAETGDVGNTRKGKTAKDLAEIKRNIENILTNSGGLC